MVSLFQRILPKSLRAEATPESPKVSVAPLPAAAPASQPGPSVAVTARRPLIAANGEVAGFEIRFDTAVLQRLADETDPKVIAAHAAAVLVAARLVAMGGRVWVCWCGGGGGSAGGAAPPPLARLPVHWLPHAPVPKDEPGTLIGLELAREEVLGDDAKAAVTEAVSLFQFAGGKVAWGPRVGLDIPADYALVQQGTQSLAALLGEIQSLPTELKSKQILVTDVGNVDDLEMILSHGVKYVSGALEAKSVVSEPAKPKLPLQPEVRRVSQLLHKLAAGAENAQIIEDLKGDLGLSVQLLQRINSASFAQLGGVASIDQAVVMLGRNELQRWLSMMLMQFAGKRKVSSALQEVALWRSRFLELLAIEKGAPDPGQFFTLGLASMLGLILKISAEEVVTTLGLPQEGQDALLTKSGPWHCYLHTATQVESQSLSDQSAMDDGFGGAGRVLQLSDDAWAWAAEHSDRRHAAAGKESA